jgi:hypothetical protein
VVNKFGAIWGPDDGAREYAQAQDKESPATAPHLPTTYPKSTSLEARAKLESEAGFQVVADRLRSEARKLRKKGL